MFVTSLFNWVLSFLLIYLFLVGIHCCETTFVCLDKMRCFVVHAMLIKAQYQDKYWKKWEKLMFE